MAVHGFLFSCRTRLSPDVQASLGQVDLEGGEVVDRGHADIGAGRRRSSMSAAHDGLRQVESVAEADLAQ